MKIKCKECGCGENEMMERGFYTFHRGTDDEFHICIPCKEGDDPVHLVCQCNRKAIIGSDGHHPDCHVRAHLKKLVVPDEVAEKPVASQKQKRKQ